uniref:BACK domain-containing protein n=1 Tax=Glossina palpalis gambiensis TaxID=67801 RepID=A0A1B0ALL2_9MUSC
VQELIKSEQSLIKSAESAFKAATNWFKPDDKLIHSFAEFMSQIRFPLVSTEFLTNHTVVKHLLRENRRCTQFLSEALKSHLIKVTGRIERSKIGIEHSNVRFHVFLDGGVERIKERKKKKVDDVFRKKLISGYPDISANAESYGLVIKRWNYIVPMNNGRYCARICTYSDLIYVVGQSASTVESYNPIIDKRRSCRNIFATNKGFNRPTVTGNNIYSLTQRYKPNEVLFHFDQGDGQQQHLNEMRETPDLYRLVSYDFTLFDIGKYN